MSLKSWSTTPASNANTTSGVNFAEGQLPSTVNNSARQAMADARDDRDNIEWRDWGHTPAYASTTSFTIATDVTSIYHANRRLKLTDATTLYGSVSSSSYAAPNTTINVTLDSSVLSASLTAVALGFAADQLSNYKAQTSNALQSATTTVVVNAATAPTSGQVLKATSSTAASWQTISALGTSVASTSGTSISFTSLPSWITRITMTLSGVSTNGTSPVCVQIGTGGTPTATGYIGSISKLTVSATSTGTVTTAFNLDVGTPSASDVRNGQITFTLLDSATNTWSANATIGLSNTTQVNTGACSVPLAGVMDNIRLTTTGGTDTFDAGLVNIRYE